MRGVPREMEKGVLRPWGSRDTVIYVEGPSRDREEGPGQSGGAGAAWRANGLWAQRVLSPDGTAQRIRGSPSGSESTE